MFRCDIGILVVAFVALNLPKLLLNAEIRKSCLIWGIIVSVPCIIATILIDSKLWLRTLWPEMEVLTFNTVDNRSSEWGVSPWWWYVAVALPKNLLIGLPLTLFGLVYHSEKSFIDRKYLQLIAPAALFVFMYSFLPHKEWRFIYPALTIFNLGAAITFSRILNAKKTIFN